MDAKVEYVGIRQLKARATEIVRLVRVALKNKGVAL